MIPRIVVVMAVVLECLLCGRAGIRSAQAASAPPGAVPAVPTASPSGGNRIAGPGGKSSVLVADTGEDIRDIHGPVPLPSQRSVWWEIAAAGDVGVAAVGWGLVSRRRKPPLLPHERALGALRGAGTLVGGDARTFSFTVSEIVRVYVEAAFSIRASHRTTEELLAELMQDTRPAAPHRAALAAFLHYCDLAKFACWSLSPADMAAMLTSAEAFVRATAPEGATNHVPKVARRCEGMAIA